jgi:hypothetical protein
MAAMATTLTEFANTGDSRTWTTSGHTAVKPKLVIQKRRVPVGGQHVAETTYSVIHAGVDADGAVLPSKVVMSVTVRYPVEITGTTISDVLTILKDMVAGDEFAASVTSQNFLK